MDLVGSQFDIASGAGIKDLAIKSDGYAIEARVNAEKLVRTGDEIAFRPHPGEIKVAFSVRGWGGDNRVCQRRQGGVPLL